MISFFSIATYMQLENLSCYPLATRKILVASHLQLENLTPSRQLRILRQTLTFNLVKKI
jgi:hypothetical protein